MERFEQLVSWLESAVWDFGIPVGDGTIPLVVIALLGTGFYLTFRLGFIQVRKLKHGAAVTSGMYDDPDEPGDVSHFQALTTALSATVGIGNIAGVALAIHLGGPGALFWMWMTAILGMAVKYSEVTLAQQYREVDEDYDPTSRAGSASGGPMYYIERGLGPKWKPLAIFFAVMLGLTAFMTGNAIQANTVADVMRENFALATWITGLVTTTVVGLVIIGGISRIGRVTAVLAPVMAAIYVFAALVIILLNVGDVVPAFGLIFREAFNPSAGIAGTGTGALLVTMMWGVQRGLFSNEAGQGSAPIAHAAAKTDEPVSEGVVALLEPFIDTICICTMTGLVIIITGVWSERLPTEIPLGSGDITYQVLDETGAYQSVAAPAELPIVDGEPQAEEQGTLAWHDVVVPQLFTDAEHTQPFTGVINPGTNNAIAQDGTTYGILYGEAVRNAAPLTMLAFQRGLAPFGDWGHYIVILAVVLFGVSTAIAWSYYGDRCAKYLLGGRAIMPYRMVFVGMHFLGAAAMALSTAWGLGNVMLGIVILPNLIALVLLTPVVVGLTKSYFERKPWVENARVHRRIVEERRTGKIHAGDDPR